MFNITYISKSETLTSQNYNIANVDTINLESRAFDVNILPTETNDISIKVYSNTFGFVLVKNKNLDISASINSGTLTFNVCEPYGAAFRNNSYIDLYIPSSKTVNLNLKNKKSETLINSKNLKIGNLSYTTENGDFDFVNGSVIGNMNLKLGNSLFTIYDNAKTNSNPTTINITTGRFDAPKAKLGDVTITKNKRGVIILGECETLKNNVKTAGGRIEATKASHVNIQSTDTDISIKEVLNGAIVKLTKTGSIKINSLTGFSDLSTQSGNIKLNHTNSNLILATDTGNITVKNAKYQISAKSNYGDIKISFANNAESYASNNNARAVIANTKKGKLVINGVENIKLTISDNGRAEVNMNNVYGDNYIDGKNGNVKIVVNKDSVYTLTTSSMYGNVKVNLTQITEYGGYTTKTSRTTNVNCLSSTNSLIASTKHGNLTVLDTTFA